MSVEAGKMRERVAFDWPVEEPDGRGGVETRFGSEDAAFKCPAEFRYQRGSEAEVAGRLTGAAQFKVRIRSTRTAKAITADCRMRDLRRGTAFNVREVDAISDLKSVWLIVESGVAI